MATYKLIQDIEAEDKLIGPLTPRQCLFAAGAALGGWASFILFTNDLKFLLPITVLPTLFLAFFAAPFGRDQPTEVWALAKIRFMVLPRKRVWNQSGVTEMVTITVPKRVEKTYTDGLSQTEVKSRLSALATTIDSRGWAVKNVNVNLYSQPNLITQVQSDRLIDPSSLPQEVPNFEVSASGDILDERSNPLAQKMTSMINASTTAHRQQIIEKMNASIDAQKPVPALSQPNWFMGQPQPVAQPPVTPVQQAPLDEAALTAQLKANRAQRANTETYSHLRTINPIDHSPVARATPMPQPAAPAPQNIAPPAPVTPQKDAVILALSGDNDKSIATLAREAERAKKVDLPPDNEVVISFH